MERHRTKRPILWSITCLLVIYGIEQAAAQVDPGQTPEPSLSVTQSPTSEKIKVVELNGAQYLTFDFTRLPDEYVDTAINGSFGFRFVTIKESGLIWHQGDVESPYRQMYFAMERGRLLFVVSYPDGVSQELTLGAKAGVRFDNSRWHKLDIDRHGRNITITVDGKYPEKMTFPESDNLHSQFLVRSRLFVGGAPNVGALTDNRVSENFQGEIGAFEYGTTVQTPDNRVAKSVVSLIAEVEDRPDLTYKEITIRADQDYQVATKPKITAVTMRDPGAYLLMPNILNADPNTQFALTFQTIKPEGMLMYSAEPSGSPYLMMEIFDRDLYLVSKFGRQSQRTLLMKDAADGIAHKITLDFGTRSIDAKVDSLTPNKIKLPGKDTLPQALGQVYLASVASLDGLPWHTWAREGYMGCIQDVIMDKKVQDLRPAIINQIRSLAQFNRIDQTCTKMPPTCATINPCKSNGICETHWAEQTCDCRNTDYAGDTCQIPSTTALFTGKNFLKLNFRPRQTYHTEDISFRFKCLSRDGLLFQTDARGDDHYISGELEDGKLVVNTNLGGKTEDQEKVNNTSLSFGDNLCDSMFHTVIIKRRADNISVYIDGKSVGSGILPGEGFFHNVDEVYLGGYDRQDIIDAVGEPFFFKGYVRNFVLGSYDIVDEIKASGTDDGSIVEGGITIPTLVFNDVTVPTYNTHTCLEKIGSVADMDISISFKTVEENGVILFTSESTSNADGKTEPNGIMFVVELFNGNLFVKLTNPGRTGIDVQSPRQFNDDKWHTLTMRAQDNQMVISLDNGHSVHGFQGLSKLNLDAPLCLAGMSKDFFSSQRVQSFISARHGYRGCLASLTREGQSVNVYEEAGKDSGFLDTCQAIKSKCTEDTCNGGNCYEYKNNGTTWCDCGKTGFSGAQCSDEPVGYYIHPKGLPDKLGCVIYSFPEKDHRNFRTDTIILGVLTDKPNSVVLRLDSATHDDFIEFKIVNNDMTVVYDTDGKGASTSITNGNVNMADGRYHIVKFTRRPQNGTLTVDDKEAIISHPSNHDQSNRLSLIQVGCLLENGQIKNGSSFRGVLGGLYINGRQVFTYVQKGKDSQVVGDAEIAKRPFRLVAPQVIMTVKPGDTATVPTRVETTPKKTVWVTDAPIVAPVTDKVKPGQGGKDIFNLPAGVGGGGVAFDGANVIVYPKGSVGGAYKIGGGPAVGESVAGASTGLSFIPIMPKDGPRAGAFVGIILGAMIGLSSIMWAGYLFKPGCCCGPHADVLVIGAPDEEVLIPQPITVADGFMTQAAPKAPSVAESVSLAGVGSVNETRIERTIVNNYTINNTAMDSVDSAFLPAGYHTVNHNINNHTMNMNMNHHNGTVTYNRHNSTGGYSVSDRQHLLGAQTMTRLGRNYSVGHSEMAYPPGESTTADYDIATGVHNPADFKGSTLRVNNGMKKGISTSTLGSHYNMTVKNTRYNTMGTSHMIVTPGAMGEEVRVDCCLLGNDGRTVVTGSSLGPPQVWNLSDGSLLRMMQGSPVGCTSLHLCDQRLLIGAVNADLEVNNYSMPKGVHNYVFQIWDFASGRPLDMGTEPEVCSALCLMSDTDKVLFGRTDCFGGGTNVIVWDLQANQSIKEMRYDAPVGNNDYISFLSLSQNDRFAVAGFTNSFDNQAEFVVFDMTLTSYTVSDPLIVRLDAEPSVTALLVADEAVTGLRTGELVIWSLKGLTRRQLTSYSSSTAHDRAITAVSRSENGQYLVSASVDGTLKLWDMNSERLMATLQGHTDEVWCCAISSDNEVIASGSRDGNIRLWKLRNGQEIAAFNVGVDVFHIAMSRDGGTIVALGDKYGARKLIMLQVVRSKVRRTVPIED